MVSRSSICCSLARKCPDNKLCAGLVSRVARLWPGTASAAGRLHIVYLDGFHGQGGSREAPGDCRSYPIAPTTLSGRRPGSTAAWRAGCQLTQLLRLARLAAKLATLSRCNGSPSHLTIPGEAPLGQISWSFEGQLLCLGCFDSVTLWQSVY